MYVTSVWTQTLTAYAGYKFVLIDRDIVRRQTGEMLIMHVEIASRPIWQERVQQVVVSRRLLHQSYFEIRS